MDNSLLISVLIPIYNVEKYISRCLESVFSQTYRKIEYIFVDDNSPDESVAILKDMILKYQINKDRYKIIRHNNNLGIAITRSDCINNAKGDYVYFVDSDDWIEANAVEMMVNATNCGDIDIVGCDYIDEYDNGKESYHHESYADTCRENMIRCLNYDVSPVLWKMLIRRKLFDLFIITPNINIGEDYSISVKLYYYAESFKSLHEAFYHYVHYNHTKLSYQRKRSLEDHICIVKEVECFLQEKGVYDNVIENRLLLRKFNIKSNYILNKMLMNENAFKSTFPEAKGMWREMNYSREECIKFWLAEHGFFSVLNLLSLVSR